jgi:hypothetical protein
VAHPLNLVAALVHIVILTQLLLQAMDRSMVVLVEALAVLVILAVRLLEALVGRVPMVLVAAERVGLQMRQAAQEQHPSIFLAQVVAAEVAVFLALKGVMAALVEYLAVVVEVAVRIMGLLKHLVQVGQAVQVVL